MKLAVKRREREAGQAVLLVVLAMSIVLIGALGLAIDGSHMYAQRQMAQAAADAAAQAGMLSIFDGTNTSGPHQFATGLAFTCGESDPRTPCYYAQLNGFGTAADLVTVDTPAGASPPSGVTLSPATVDPVNLVRVTVQRTLTTGLIRFLGPSTSIIRATATAAIVNVKSAIPILVTHPTLSGAFLLSGGGPKIKVCGGPPRSIQVNSNSAVSVAGDGGAVVDLSQAGPALTGSCGGSGADFGAFGGPETPSFILNTGTGHFVQPASPILDPLSGIAAPPIPSTTGRQDTATPVSTAQGCPPSPPEPCHFYTPGLYTTSIRVQNEVAVFQPGIYYMQGSDFQTAANGYMTMATGFTDGSSGTNTGWTRNMLVYMTATGSPAVTGTINIGASGSVNLGGAPADSAYQGILFYVDRNAAPATHTLDGTGGLTLTGTIYVTNSLSAMRATPTQFQTVNIQNGGGIPGNITGEIIVSALSVSGTAGTTVTLSNQPTYTVRQVALVN